MFVHIRENKTPVELRAAEIKVVNVRRQEQRIVLFIEVEDPLFCLNLFSFTFSNYLYS